MDNKLSTTLILCLLMGSLYYIMHQSPDEYISINQFAMWKQQFNIEYKNSDEEIYRKQIFKANRKKIDSHNKQEKYGYKMSINQFGALTQKQFINTYLNEHRQETINADDKWVRRGGPNIDIDWLAKGVVLPVQNSGSGCAASYAYSSVGALQSLRAIKDGILAKLSKQQVVDCSTKYGNSGCNGGLPANTYKYTAQNGISLDSQYPWTGTARACQHTYSTFKISGYSQQKNCDQLQTALMKQPISVLVDASNWMFYRSGIFDKCDSSTINFAVLLVGMTDANWKVKNQWGSSWGQNGYMRLQMGNCCQICMKGSAPIK